MSFPTPTRQLLLRPVGGQQADGAQLFDVVEPEVPRWTAGVTYTLGTHVVGSDGKVYLSKVSPNKGHNPTTDSAVNWQPLW